MSYSAFFALNQRIDDLTQSIIEFFYPKGGTIYDPTCGVENHQFRSWIYQTRLNGVKYKYIRSDKEPYGDFVFDLFDIPAKKIPLKDNEADATWLDVPFTPRATEDPRGDDYKIQHDRDAEAIRAFFSADIYRELARVSKDYIFVRGQDFYYPPNTTNFYMFHDLALRTVKEAGLVVRAVYPFRYNHDRLPRIRENLKNVVRPIITHGYLAVLAKPDAPSRRNGAEIKDTVMKQNYRIEERSGMIRSVQDIDDLDYAIAQGLDRTTDDEQKVRLEKLHKRLRQILPEPRTLENFLS